MTRDNTNMTEPRPTNIMENLGMIHKSIAVMDTKLDALKESNDKEHKQINKHLESLNGSVEKNTKFRIEGRIYLLIVAFLGSTVISATVSYLFN